MKRLLFFLILFSSVVFGQKFPGVAKTPPMGWNHFGCNGINERVIRQTADAGAHTYQGRPGSKNYKEPDAKIYSEWGVDYLKYDWCNTNGMDPKKYL